MLISCLCPTWNRFPQVGFLVEEAVESFLRQDHKDKELILCNDEPGQFIKYTHPQVRVINHYTRFPTLGEKLRFMIGEAQGELLCRWDDDDISLPHRLSYSLGWLNGSDVLDWRPRNYWYDPGTLVEDAKHANTHVSAIWHRSILDQIGGYPVTASGAEDQAFNNALTMNKVPCREDSLTKEEMFYIYRWGMGGTHLSGERDMQGLYNRRPVGMFQGVVDLHPRWHLNHIIWITCTIIWNVGLEWG